MSIATFRKFQMKKAATLSKKTLFSKFLRVPFLQNTPPPPLTPSSPGDWCFCIQYSYRHVWKSKSLRSDIINKKQLFIGDLENSFVKFFVKFLEKHQFPINFEIFFRTGFSNNTSRWLLLVWSKIHFDDIYKL